MIISFLFPFFPVVAEERKNTFIEQQMNAVERIKEYEELPQEAPDEIPEHRPPRDWPSKGEVKFENYGLAYRKGDLVLKNLTVQIDAREKVGIVGRTGAGKSRQEEIQFLSFFLLLLLCHVEWELTHEEFTA